MSPESVIDSDYDIDDDEGQMDQNIDVVWYVLADFKMALMT